MSLFPDQYPPADTRPARTAETFPEAPVGISPLMWQWLYAFAHSRTPFTLRQLADISGASDTRVRMAIRAALNQDWITAVHRERHETNPPDRWVGLLRKNR